MASNRDWDEAAQRAIRRFDAEEIDLVDIRNPGNMLVYLFLMEAHGALSADGPHRERLEKFAQSTRKAYKSLQTHVLRCFDVPSLRKVDWIGEVLANKVARHLWTKREPPPLTDEERDMHAAQKRAEKEKQGQMRAAKQRASSAAAAAATGASSSGATSASAGRAPGASGSGSAQHPVHLPLGAGLGLPSAWLPGAAPNAAPATATAAGGKPSGGRKRSAAASAADAGADGHASDDGGGGSGGGGGRAKKKARAPKEYVPAVGTANYAFLVVLYMAHKQGVEYETKDSLMTKAESSGLSNKSLYGVGNQSSHLAGAKWYDGWSSVNKSLVNRTPPLVQVWSNPKKVRLTAEGTVLAAKLYKDAVDRCKVTPLPGVDPDADIAAGVPNASPASAGGAPVRGQPSTCAGARAAAASPPMGPLAQAAGNTALAGPSGGGAGGGSRATGTLMSVLSAGYSGMGFGSDPLGSSSAGGTATATATASTRGGAGRAASTVGADGVISLLDSGDEDDGGGGGGSQGSGAAAVALGQRRAALSCAGPGAPAAGAAQPSHAAARAWAPPGAAAGRPPLPRAAPATGLTVDAAAAPRPVSSSGAGIASSSHTGQVGYQWDMARLRDGHTAPVLPPLPMGARFESHYDVVLLIDAREQIRRVDGKSRTESLAKLVDRIRAKGIAVDAGHHLPVGDALWVARARGTGALYVLDFLIERKGVKDLAQSIKDQRYGQQKYFMAKCGLRRRFYLVEGDPEMDVGLTDVERKAVKTAVMQTNLNGFHLLMSSGPHESLQLLASLTRAVERAYRGRMAPPAAGSTAPVFNAWSDGVKRLRASITVRDVFGLMLCCVPGAGETLVEAILDVYPTWHDLWGAYKAKLQHQCAIGHPEPHKAAEAMLADIPVGSSGLGGRQAGCRTVGRELSRQVYRCLFSSTAAV